MKTLFVRGGFGDIYAVTPRSFDEGGLFEVANVAHPAPVHITTEDLYRNLQDGWYEVVKPSTLGGRERADVGRWIAEKEVR